MIDSKRVFYGVCGSLGVLIFAIIGCAYMANGMLEKRAAVLSELKVQDEVLTREQQGLIRAKKDIAKYEELGTIARAIVPQDKDQAETVREIVKLAAESGITPTSITFPASTLGSPTAAAGGSSAATPKNASKLTQVTPVKGIPGVYIMPITITQSSQNPVEYSRFLDFLSRLEQNRRTAQVSNIVLQPDAKNRNSLSYSLTVEKYIKP